MINVILPYNIIVIVLFLKSIRLQRKHSSYLDFKRQTFVIIIDKVVDMNLYNVINQQ